MGWCEVIGKNEALLWSTGILMKHFGNVLDQDDIHECAKHFSSVFAREVEFHPDIRDPVTFYVRNGKPYVGVDNGPELLLTVENCEEWQVRANENAAKGWVFASPLCTATMNELKDLKVWIEGLGK